MRGRLVSTIGSAQTAGGPWSRSRRRLAALVATLAPVLALCVPASASAVPQDSIVSATPSASTPAVNNGRVEDIAQAGGKTFLGGTFTSASSARSTAVLTRNRILAFTSSGIVDPGFAPSLDRSVLALLPGTSRNSVYVGGSFTTLNGMPTKKLLLLDTATGAQVPGFQAPPMNGLVNDVERVGNRLYVAGTFTKVGGAAHTGLVTLDATTGKLDPYLNLQPAGHHNWTSSSSSGDAKGAVGVTRLAVNPAGTRLVAIGNFKTVDGTDRDQVLMADLTGSTATLVNWQTNRYDPRCYANAYDSWIRDVDFARDGSYFVIVGTGGYPGYDDLCDAAARWETAATGSDLQPTWVDWTGGDTLLSVAITSQAVYVGGHQRWLNNAYATDRAGPGAVPRPGLGALDPTTGLPLAWNPGRNPRGIGAGALYVAPEGLYVGSDTNVIGVGATRAQRKKIALFPLAGGVPRASDAIPTLPGRVVQTYGDGLRARTFDGTDAGAPSTLAGSFPARDASGAFVAGGSLFYGSAADGTIHRRALDGSRDVSLNPYHDPVWKNVNNGSGGTYDGDAPDLAGNLGNVSSMFYAKGRLYYTYRGVSALYSRAFSTDSGVIGDRSSVVESSSSWSGVTGAFLSGSTLYFAGSDGDLYARGWADAPGLSGPGRPTGSPVLTSGTGDWGGRAMWLQPS